MRRLPEAVNKLFDWMDASGIVWALGASSVLHLNGHPVAPRDLDLFVRQKDYDRIAGYLSVYRLGEVKEDSHGVYNTQGFATFMVEEMELDLIAGFYIRHQEGEYRFTFDRLSIDQRVDVEGCAVNVMSLEDWFVLYQLIPGREAKAEVARQLLMEKKEIRWDLLKRAVSGDLPRAVRESIQEIIR